MSEHRILIDADECIDCGACVRDCPAHNISIENGRAAAISNACIMCGHCVAICPKAAVSISGYDSCDIRENTAARLDADTVLNVIRSAARYADLRTRISPTRSSLRFLKPVALLTLPKTRRMYHL